MSALYINRSPERRIERLLMFIKQRGECGRCGTTMVIDRASCNRDTYATFTSVPEKRKGRVTVLWCRRCNERTARKRQSRRANGEDA